MFAACSSLVARVRLQFLPFSGEMFNLPVVISRLPIICCYLLKYLPQVNSLSRPATKTLLLKPDRVLLSKSTPLQD